MSRPVPVPDPERTVRVSGTRHGAGGMHVLQEISWPGNSVATTIFPRKLRRTLKIERPHFLGKIVAPSTSEDFVVRSSYSGNHGPI